MKLSSSCLILLSCWCVSVASSTVYNITQNKRETFSIHGDGCEVFMFSFGYPMGGSSIKKTSSTLKIDIWELDGGGKGQKEDYPNLLYGVLTVPETYSGLITHNTPSTIARCDKDYSAETCWETTALVESSGYDPNTCQSQVTPISIDLTSVHAARKMAKQQSSVLMYGDKCNTAKAGTYYLFIRSKKNVSFSLLVTAVQEEIDQECSSGSSSNSRQYDEFVLTSVAIGLTVVFVLCFCLGWICYNDPNNQDYIQSKQTMMLNSTIIKKLIKKQTKEAIMTTTTTLSTASCCTEMRNLGGHSTAADLTDHIVVATPLDEERSLYLPSASAKRIHMREREEGV